MKNDPKALLADSFQTLEWPGFRSVLGKYKFTVLLYVGSEDGFYTGVKEAVALLPDVQLVVFSGENHRTAFVKKKLLLPHLSRFLGKLLT